MSLTLQCNANSVLANSKDSDLDLLDLVTVLTKQSKQKCYHFIKTSH